MFGSPTANEADRSNAGTGIGGANPGSTTATTSNGVSAAGQTIDSFDGNNGNAVSPGNISVLILICLNQKTSDCFNYFQNIRFKFVNFMPFIFVVHFPLKLFIKVPYSEDC